MALFNRSPAGTFTAKPPPLTDTETVRARLAAAEEVLADKALGKRCLAAAISDAAYRPAEIELGAALTRISLLQRALQAAEDAERDQVAEKVNAGEKAKLREFADHVTALGEQLARYRSLGVVDARAYQGIVAAYRAAHALLPPSPNLVTAEQHATLADVVAMTMRGTGL